MIVYLLAAAAGVIAAPYLRLRFFVGATVAVCAVMAALSFAKGGWSPIHALFAFALMQICYFCAGLALEYFDVPRPAEEASQDDPKISRRRR